VTIWRQENPVPTTLPAALLYLEDIEEIVRICRKLLSEAQDADQSPTTRFRIGKEFSDQVEDLPKIAQRTTDFSVELSVGKWKFPNVRFGVSKYSTQWTSEGLPKDRVWEAFRKLEALLEKRTLRWSNLLHSHGQWSNGIYGAATVILLFLFTFLFANKVSLAARLIAFGAVAAPVLMLRTGLSHHSVVVLRNSWDQAAQREELKARMITGVVPAFIGAFLGIVGTILVAYLRHKYWP